MYTFNHVTWQPGVQLKLGLIKCETAPIVPRQLVPFCVKKISSVYGVVNISTSCKIVNVLIFRVSYN